MNVVQRGRKEWSEHKKGERRGRLERQRGKQERQEGGGGSVERETGR